MLARIALWLGSLGFVAAVVGPLFAHLELVRPLIGFAVMGIGLLDSVLALICGIIALVRGPAGDRGTAIGGMLPAVLVLAAVLVAASPGGSAPRINDITTDTQNPPQFKQATRLEENSGRDMSYPGESFAAQQRAGYGEIKPLALAASPGEVFARALEKANTVPGWEVILADPRTRTIEGIDTSWLFRFADDFVIEVRDGADGGSLVHMRSKSRDGKGDLGANAKRIRDFFALLQ
jgi:uncharacterized protein (DUF1499 family)